MSNESRKNIYNIKVKNRIHYIRRQDAVFYMRYCMYIAKDFTQKDGALILMGESAMYNMTE